MGYYIGLTDKWLIPYEKSNKLKDNDYGFAIKAGGVFIERKNAGWCGTPPINFGDFEGTWTGNDSIRSALIRPSDS